MSQITLQVFDIFTKRQIESVQYENGYGNLTKLKMELAMRRKIIYFDDIILTNSDGQVIKSQDELEDQQQIWFDCPNPIYDKNKKQKLSIQEHIISIKTQLNSQQLRQNNYRKSIQLSNKVIDQQFDMKQSSIQNVSTTFDNIEESKSFLFDDIHSSQSEKVISNFQIESSAIGDEKKKRKQQEAWKLYQQFNIKQNQNENNKEAIKEYFELKQKNQEEIRKIEEKKQQIIDKMKQAKPHELQEQLDKLKQLEEEKQKRLKEKQLIEDQFCHEREISYRFKIFQKVNVIKQEMYQMANYFKTLPDSNMNDKINQFYAKINEIVQISQEKFQQTQQ